MNIQELLTKPLNFMDKTVLITTTNQIEGSTVERYLGTITAHVVLGTHIFSDFGASLTDVFGGRSGTYQRKLENLYQIATTQLKDRAYQKGANAIIGLQIDFNEISGKGKSMFMVSAIGTAIKLKLASPMQKEETDKITEVSLQDLEIKLEHQRLIGVLKSGGALYQVDWDFLFENPTDEINEYILDIYPDGNLIQQVAELIQNIHTYFGCVKPEVAVKCIYNRLVDNPKYVNILRANNLLSPENVLNLLEKGHHGLSATCLDIGKLSYDLIVDIPIMERLAEKFDNLPDTGEIKFMKGGMMSKDKEKFICSEGHQNVVSNEFCSDCGKNIKGLTQEHLNEIKRFKNKISVLKEMMNQ